MRAQSPRDHRSTQDGHSARYAFAPPYGAGIASLAPAFHVGFTK